MHTTKLIVLRGNSGSGKSTIARALHESSTEPTVYISQDYFRRVVLNRHDENNFVNATLIKSVALSALKLNHSVILDGIFTTRKYKTLLREIIGVHPENNYFFYLDVSLEETLKRHQTKPNSDDFGEKQMRDWYTKGDYLDCAEEIIISENSTLQESIKNIQEITGVSQETA